MAWPDFSELTYAFGFVRELESYFGAFPLLPTFLTQPKEAAKGYDAEIDLAGTMLFVQFKRSEVMNTYRAKELKDNYFAKPPVFRMHLRKKNGFAQHQALAVLEQGGNAVIYAASGAISDFRLRLQFRRKTVIDSSGIFMPSEIQLPDQYGPHHVSFVPGTSGFQIFSEKGMRYERKFPDISTLERDFLRERATSDAANRRRLEHLTALDARESLFDDIESVIKRAASAVMVKYGCYIVVVPPAKSAS